MEIQSGNGMEARVNIVQRGEGNGANGNDGQMPPAPNNDLRQRPPARPLPPPPPPPPAVPVIVDDAPGLDAPRRVFQVAELRDMIFRYALQNNETKTLDRATALNMRAVQKDWYTDVGRLFQEKGEPLYKLVLKTPRAQTPYGTIDVERMGRKLDRFVMVVAQGRHHLGVEFQLQIPTISLTVSHDFFVATNQDSLFNFFLHCGRGLVKLEMNLPVGGGALRNYFPEVNLPRLQELVITMTNRFHINYRPGNRMRTFPAWERFMMCIINGARDALTCLTLATPRYTYPLFFELLNLPSKIKKLEIMGEADSEDLGHILLSTKYDHLTSLTLLVCDDTFSDADQILSKVLDEHKATLQTLIINGHPFKGVPVGTSLTTFPVMQNLENLIIKSTAFGLKEEARFTQDFFPKLGLLKLNYQTGEMFSKWVINSTYPTVKQLQFSMVEPSEQELTQYVSGVDMATMQNVHRAFPNLEKLELAVLSSEATGIKYIFRQMRALKALKIVFVRSSARMNEDFGDSVLIGTGVEFMTGLRTDPEIWGNVTFQTGNMPSIKNMRELVSLTFEDKSSEHGYLPGPLQPLMSDLAFRFVLLDMPNLMDLNLTGRFVASDEMVETWKSQVDGRTFSYSPFKKQK